MFTFSKTESATHPLGHKFISSSKNFQESFTAKDIYVPYILHNQKFKKEKRCIYIRTISTKNKNRNIAKNQYEKWKAKINKLESEGYAQIDIYKKLLAEGFRPEFLCWKKEDMIIAQILIDQIDGYNP